MKIVLGSLTVVAFLIFVLAASSTPVAKTEYQKCMSNAKHLRSDNDTARMERICDMLPVDPRDMR